MEHTQLVRDNRQIQIVHVVTLNCSISIKITYDLFEKNKKLKL